MELVAIQLLDDKIIEFAAYSVDKYISEVSILHPHLWVENSFENNYSSHNHANLSTENLIAVSNSLILLFIIFILVLKSIQIKMIILLYSST